MKIDFSALSDADLSALIVGAMQEWGSRQQNPQEVVIERKPAPAPRVITINEPKEADKQFALSIKTQLQRGLYIKAGERTRVAELAEKYPDWVMRQGLPTERGTAAWRQAKDFYTRYRPAEEM